VERGDVDMSKIPHMDLFVMEKRNQQGENMLWMIHDVKRQNHVGNLTCENVHADIKIVGALNLMNEWLVASTKRV
jgi:hypothetical protein